MSRAFDERVQGRHLSDPVAATHDLELQRFGGLISFMVKPAGHDARATSAEGYHLRPKIPWILPDSGGSRRR